MTYFIKLTQGERNQLNTLLMRYVIDNGQYIQPFNPITSEYLDDSLFYMVDSYIEKAATDPAFTLSERAFVSGLLLLKKTYEEAVLAGWIVPVSL